MNTNCGIATILGTRVTVTSYIIDLLERMVRTLEDLRQYVFCSIKAARNVYIVHWGAGLGSLESLNLIQCLVPETKKKEARNQRPITPT